jgi:beta-lactamase regulating signal transducer with metallopeptidase domain
MMISLFDSFADWQADAWLSALGSASLKAMIILLAACAAQWLWRRASAAARHLLWSLTLAGALALPLLGVALPEWRIAPAWWPLENNQTQWAETAAIEPALRAVPILPPPRQLAFESLTPAMVKPPVITVPSWQWRWPQALLLLWCGGVLLLLSRMLVGAVRAWRLADGAQEVNDWSWTLLIDEVSARLRLHRRIEVRTGEAVSMPVTCGVWRTLVLLPAEAESWPVEWRRMVLLHEMAHARRRDCLTQMLAQLACVLYWFNPLVWLAARRLRLEREMACDDEVLAAGTRASDYAGYLLNLAREVKTSGFASPVMVGMACSQLESRVRAILLPDLKRQRLSRAAIAGGILFIAGLIAPLSALSWKAEASERAPQKSSVLTKATAAAKVYQAESFQPEIAAVLAAASLKGGALHPGHLLAKPLVAELMAAFSQESAQQRSEAKPSSQEAEEIRARIEEFLRHYAQQRGIRILTLEQAELRELIEALRQQYEQAVQQSRLERMRALQLAAPEQAEIEARLEALKQQALEQQELAARYYAQRKELPESEELRAKMARAVEAIAALQQQAGAQRELSEKMREEQLRLLQQRLSETVLQAYPEALLQLQEELRKRELELANQARLEASQQAAVNQAAALERYQAQLEAMDQARLDEMSRALASQAQAALQANDARLSQAYAELILRKAELEAKLSQLRESQTGTSPDVVMAREKLEALSREMDRMAAIKAEQLQRLSTAYGQLIWRKAMLEAEIRSLLRRVTSEHPDVQFKRAELEALKRELDKLLK